MSKRTKALEKESYDWRSKYDKCNRALLNMVGDKQTQDAYVTKSARQVAQLQKLCRTLQAERTALVDVLTVHNIERPVMPELPPAPTDIEPPPKSADKLDIMSRNCLELKQSLAVLQGQMNALEMADAAKPAASASSKDNTPAAANKKAKNKKPKAKVDNKKTAAVPVVATEPATAAAESVQNGSAEAVAATPEVAVEAEAAVLNGAQVVSEEEAAAPVPESMTTESSDVVAAEEISQSAVEPAAVAAEIAVAIAPVAPAVPAVA